MERRFIKLRQEDMTVDAYATEFLRLSKSAPISVVEERDKAHRF